ncbi:MAG: hypothetical protein WD876_03965 [Candidatus Pacearchaeota archaeon]
MMKKKVIIGVVFGIVFLVAGFLLITHFTTRNSQNIYGNQENNSSSQYQENQENQEEQNQEEQNNQRGQEIDPNCQLVFTEYLVEPKYVQKFGQVGVVHGGGKSIVERSYISIKQDFYEQEIPVYAPADMNLIGAAHYKIPGSPENTLADYVLKFNTKCNVEILLGHLKKVVPEIDKELPTLQQDSRENYNINRIEFKAGELIGYYVQQSQPGAVSGFDFIVRDPRFTNQFINQERYSENRASNLINGVCPYDYFTSDKKQEYYNLLGSAGGKIFTIKDCGTASQDKSGTISGMWFMEKEVTKPIYEYESDPKVDYVYGTVLSIAGDEEAVTIGNLGQSAIIRVYYTELSYKLPTEVTEEHCYEFGFNGQNNGYAYFKLIDASTMDVYYSPSGSCPQTMPSESKRYYK